MVNSSEKVKTLIQSRVSLAPMAGITDYVLRSLIREHSKTCLLTTEMISSEALTQVKDTDIVVRDDNHSPISYQLSGHKPKMLADSAEYLQKYADMIDINMGCPVNKVVKGTDGCALMRNIGLAEEIVKTVKSQISIPLSVKFRLGYTFDELNFIEYGQKMQNAGADFITIHGRTRSQMYGGKADWKKIAELKRNVDIPVFANGDVVSIETAIQCLEESQADGVAIGRGVLGDPTLIARIEKYLSTGEYISPPTLEEKIEYMKQLLLREVEFRGENIGIKFVR
ncbi:tRNA-dihydrouridine synthase family protein, partial [bacterium]|nr:tRNA-dihydrouridine synthase family protein [bacterium]